MRIEFKTKETDRYYKTCKLAVHGAIKYLENYLQKLEKKEAAGCTVFYKDDVFSSYEEIQECYGYGAFSYATFAKLVKELEEAQAAAYLDDIKEVRCILNYLNYEYRRLCEVTK